MCVEWGKAVLFLLLSVWDGVVYVCVVGEGSIVSLLSVWGGVVYVCMVGEGSIVFTVECVGWGGVCV